MTPERRRVRVGEAFFAQLDGQLTPDRGPQGQPSSTDFDALPEIVEGFGGARMLIARGLLVRAFAVYGLLMADDSIELIGVELDVSP